LTFNAKAKDLSFKAEDKDLKIVLKDSLRPRPRPRTPITDIKQKFATIINLNSVIN